MRKNKVHATEELVQTQVLNIDEVRKVAKYERKTSKKPVVFLGLLGSILVLSGFGTQGYITYNNKVSAEKAKQQAVVARKIEKKQAEENKKEETPKITKKENETILTCNRVLTNQETGLSRSSMFVFHFEDGLLKREEKTLTVQVTTGAANGEANFNSSYLNYSNLQTTNINGYSMSTKKLTEKSFQVAVQIDFLTLNTESLPDSYKSDAELTPDFTLNCIAGPIKDVAESLGFTCSIE